MTRTLQPFHLAFPVDDLESSRAFYADLLGCKTGRESDTWIDFDLFGHQVVAHLSPERSSGGPATNPVDGDDVPIPHFGVVLTHDQWDRLRDRLMVNDTIRWVVRPKVRFAGQPGEQRTMFLLDPSGNALEFKAMAGADALFSQ